MQSSVNYPVAADFRDDPMMMALLRKAISVVGFALPDFDDTTFEALLTSYRQSKGERSHDVRYSVAKQELDAHASKFRTQYSTILASCLNSQLDRLQGREAAWPAMESDSPELVPDSVIERRLVIDELTRLIDNDADEGVKTFDVLVCTALGRRPTTIRENPLRPAVFFHALGLCWTRAAGDSRDELMILRNFGPSIADRVISVYPQMTAILRDGLGVRKPGSSSLVQRSKDGDGKLYARMIDGKLVERDPDEVDTALDDQQTVRRPNKIDPSAMTPAALAQAQTICDRVGGLFEMTLIDERLPREVRLALSRMQIPLTRTLLADPAMLTTADHPLRRLLRDVMSPTGWQRLAHGPEVLQAIVMHLGVIAEMLRRDRRDPVRDAMLYDHLRSQFLALRSAPAPRLEVPDEDDEDDHEADDEEVDGEVDNEVDNRADDETLEQANRQVASQADEFIDKQADELRDEPAGEQASEPVQGESVS